MIVSNKPSESFKDIDVAILLETISPPEEFVPVSEENLIVQQYRYLVSKNSEIKNQLWSKKICFAKNGDFIKSLYELIKSFCVKLVLEWSWVLMYEYKA